MELIHGGDIQGFRDRYGREPLDLSANTNPFGLPHGVRATVIRALDHADQYPDPLCRGLRQAIGQYEGSSPDYVFCGNGAADVIYRLVLARRPEKAIVLAPTFAEYEQALEAAGCKFARHYLAEPDCFDVTEKMLEKIDGSVDMVFLCNPNNPTGRLTNRDLMGRILKQCEANGAMLLVDECFLGMTDVEDDVTMKVFLEHKNLFLLKAFTKQFGMAGIRLGYGLTSDRRLIHALFHAGQPWSVSSIAQAAGIAAIEEHEYLIESKKVMAASKEALLNKMDQWEEVSVIGASANYIFFKTSIPDLGNKMADQGILIRGCENYPGLDGRFYRIAVKGMREAEAFLTCLDAVRDREK